MACLCHFASLTRLVLDGDRLTALPEGLELLSGLQHLSLDCNFLVTLPTPIISALTSLTYLSAVDQATGHFHLHKALPLRHLRKLRKMRVWQKPIVLDSFGRGIWDTKP